jgi:hypothetical protein
MIGDQRTFNSIDTSGNDEFESITFGGNGKGKVKGLGKIAISNDMSILEAVCGGPGRRIMKHRRRG